MAAANATSSTQAPPVMAEQTMTRTGVSQFVRFDTLAQPAAAPKPRAPGIAPPRHTTGIARLLTTNSQPQLGMPLNASFRPCFGFSAVAASLASSAGASTAAPASSAFP